MIISAALRDYMATPAPDYILLVPAPPGSGKTWSGVQFAHEVHAATGQHVFYAGPRHDLYPDIVAASMRQDLDASQWLEWQPRQEHDEITLHTCNHADAINIWLHRGHDGMDFCSQRCGYAYVNNGCPYHAQKRKPNRLIYGQHAHVTMGHPLAKSFAVVIGDELPLAAFLNTQHIPTRWILPPDMPLADPLADVLNAMRGLADNEREKPYQGAELYRALDPRRVIAACEAWTVPADAIVAAPRIDSDKDVQSVPYNYLLEFVPALLREAMAAAAGVDFPQRIRVTKTGLSFDGRRYVNEQMPAHVVWFDATGKADLYEKMFRRPVLTVDIRPKLTGRIFQVTDRANGKGSLVEDGEPTARVAQLSAQIDAIRSRYKTTAVVTYQSLEQTVGGITAHFYGNRGSNAHEQCDAIIVAGTPQPPLPQIEHIARCLEPTRMRPFDVTWVTAPRRYNYRDADGNGYEYPIGQFADPDLNVILHQFRESEIIQAAHRGRILFRDSDVWLLTNLPIDELPPVQLLSTRELFGAPEGVDAFRWRQFMAWATALAEERGFVTVADIIEWGAGRDSAQRYMVALVEVEGWRRIDGVMPPGAKGGRPRRAAGLVKKG